MLPISNKRLKKKREEGKISNDDDDSSTSIFFSDFYELSFWSPAISRLSPTAVEQPWLQVC